MDNEIRLIDANALKEFIGTYDGTTAQVEAVEVKYIDNAPTVSAYTFEEVEGIRQATIELVRANCKNDRPQGEWIPVSIQEPDVGGIYLVTAKHVSGHIGTDIARRVSDNVWTFGGDELLGTEIIAWMPLPEPYKEKENE